jgi:hypothetical protein
MIRKVVAYCKGTLNIKKLKGTGRIGVLILAGLVTLNIKKLKSTSTWFPVKAEVFNLNLL